MNLMAEKKPYVRWEDKLIREFLQKEHPNNLAFKHPKVGKDPAGTNAKYAMCCKRYPDVVFKDGSEIFIVEAKIKPDVGAISQLKLYMQLFPETPMFSEWRTLHLRGILITALPDRQLSILAKNEGIEHIVFKPSFMQEWIDKYILKK